MNIRREVENIQEAIVKVREYTKWGRSKFDTDEPTRLSIIYYLVIIGEAASNSHMTQRFKDRHPEVPWRRMIHARNFLIHNYDAPTAEYVWRTATIDVPIWQSKIDVLLLSKQEDFSE